MRLTKVLRAQHLGWYFKKHWQVQGKRTPIDTGAKEALSGLNIPVVDAIEFIEKNPIEEALRAKNFAKFIEPRLTKVEINNKKCYVYRDKNVLIEGVTQARVLTNTVEILSMPKRIERLLEKMTISNTVDKNVQNAILSSFVYDTEQEKLARIKDPNRPAFVFPRVYGITDDRKSRLSISKLLFECEKLAGKIISGKRKIIYNDVNFISTIYKEGDKIQLNIPVQVLITSDRPIEPFQEKYNSDIPDLYPLKCTISIPKENELVIKDFYPLDKDLNNSHPHTVITYYSPLKVTNLHKVPVTTSQYQARTFMAAFAAAASRAQQLYGDMKILPKPIVVQSVQTNGKSFHFGVYQLNTLDFDNTDGIKNYWFHLPNFELFQECCYSNGQPLLNEYNKKVIQYLRAFYQNQ